MIRSKELEEVVIIEKFDIEVDIEVGIEVNIESWNIEKRGSMESL